MKTQVDITHFVQACEWSDLPKDMQRSCYWYAVPKNEDDILDGMEFEIVYVYFDGKWSVMRIREAGLSEFEDFLFLHPVPRPTGINCG